MKLWLDVFGISIQHFTISPGQIHVNADLIKIQAMA
jgi:hypothetical protein